ncbi:hypothetical protein M426DRAFT_268255 [Hypoxylon sp. CI-4A]|nr:hypothetical protein M426DRAFT_268255 [Hypoxylon sp. CI-4A]
MEVVTPCSSSTSIPNFDFARLPCFGQIHTKLMPSTRTLDSRFLFDYHSELDSLHRVWELRVLDYWESHWHRNHPVQGCRNREEPMMGYLYRSTSAGERPRHPSRSLKDYLRRFSLLERHIRDYLEQKHLKRDQIKAVTAKREIDAHYRNQLGMRERETDLEDFPLELDELVCYWDPWYVTEWQPTPYMRSKAGGNYMVNEYYSSDHQLRLRKVFQKDGAGTVTACFRPEDFDKLDVVTLYVYEPKR